MPKTYSSTGSNLHPYQFDDATLLAVGRLIRVCADLEDALTYFIGEVAQTSEGIANLMLGKMAVSQRQRIAATLVDAKGTVASKELMTKLFGSHFGDIFRCRNTAAHGVLLGITDDGQIAFELTEPTDEPLIFATVVTYKPTDFHLAATAGAKMLAILDQRLKLPAWREKRLAQSLRPHHKAQSKGRANAKPPHPPRPSGA